jgi:hypothetical protein
LDSRNAASERRSQVRYEVSLPGEIIWQGGDRRQHCTIRDLSLNGARVELPFFTEFPTTIYLLEQGSGKLFECDVRWQQGCQMGVFFVDVAGHTARRALLQKHAGV